MRILLDTNILLRISEPSHPHHQPTVRALESLAAADHTFAIGSQTIYEFLAVATRTASDRGLGMNQAAADQQLSKLIPTLDVLCDSLTVVAELRRLVVAYAVSGKSVHDARLVATMIAHGVSHILTLNGRDFARYAEATILDPTSMPLMPPA